MRIGIISVVVSGIVLVCSGAGFAVELTLGYQAETHAYAYAQMSFTDDSHTDHDNSSNSPCQSKANAYVWLYEGGPGVDDYEEWAESRCEVNAGATQDSGTVVLTSKIKGWGRWGWDYYPAGGGQGTHYEADGGGNGNGYASLQGTISVGEIPSYPPGVPGPALAIFAHADGNTSGDWYDHTWWLKIWTEDPNNPLAVLDQNTTSAEISMESGDVFNFTFYHFSEKFEWPENGLSTSVSIQIALLVPNIADMDGDGLINLTDFAFLASQWRQEPNLPPADIYYFGGNGIVDVMDLWWMTKAWLQSVVAVVYPASGPSPSDQETVAPQEARLLTWEPGYGAFSHDVYFGTDFNDVNDANVNDANIYAGNYDVNFFDPCTVLEGGLFHEGTYYWRIDELGLNCTTKGDVWSFRVSSLGWWKLDEGSGMDAFDSGGYNHGVLYGDPNWVTGKVGPYALDFDGDGDYIEIPDDAFLTPASQISIAFWLYNRGGQNAGIYKYASCPSEEYSPGDSRAYLVSVIDDTATVRFRVFSAVSTSDMIESNNTIGLNQWHHIAATFNEGAAAIYIDGQPDNSAALSVSSIMNDAQPLIIGGYWSYCGADQFVNALNGQIDDVRIYNRPLSESEIQQLYEMGQ